MSSRDERTAAGVRIIGIEAVGHLVASLDRACAHSGRRRPVRSDIKIEVVEIIFVSGARGQLPQKVERQTTSSRRAIAELAQNPANLLGDEG